MNLDEAIKLIYLYRHIDDSLCIEDVNKSLELGWEALKEIKRLRKEGVLPREKLLPGETKD